MQATTTRKRELRDMGDEVSQSIGGRSVHPFVGTWMDRPGCSVEVRLTSKSVGKRVIIHKWDDEDTCSVRFITGNFWRDPDNARTFGEADGVSFDAESITTAAQELLGS